LRKTTQRFSFFLATVTPPHYLGIMEEYEILEFTELPVAHFHFQNKCDPHSLSVDNPNDGISTSTGSGQLGVICSGPHGLTVLTLLFDVDDEIQIDYKDIPIRPFAPLVVSEKTASNITIHFPVKHFAAIFTMLQEAFSNKRHTVKLTLSPDKVFHWSVNLDFIPKGPF
jgi:hypothetical protein